MDLSLKRVDLSKAERAAGELGIFMGINTLCQKIDFPFEQAKDYAFGLMGQNVPDIDDS